GGEGRGLFLRRLRVALDGDVDVAVGEPVAERDQVILGGQLGILELLLPALANGTPNHKDSKEGDHGYDADDDQEVPQRVRGWAGRLPAGALPGGLPGAPLPGLLLHLGHEVGQRREDVLIRLMLLD